MIQRKHTLILLAVAIALFLLSPPLFAKDDLTVTILHVNDFHGMLLPHIVRSVDEKTPVGGAAYLARMIRDERAKNPEGTLLLSAGDMFQGSPASNLFRGRPVIEIMNLLGFDAMALGNHEFDWGADVLGNLLRSAAFPFLSANVRDREGKYPAGVLPYHLVERKGAKVAIIGITTPETPYTTKPDNVKGLVFSDPAAVLGDLLREVKEKGADIVVILSHLGFDEDKNLAAKVGGIDVIVGGHSHTAVTKPEKVGNTIVVQAGYHGIYLGVVGLLVDPDRKSVTGYSGGLRVVSAGADIQKDEGAQRIVNAYNDRLRKTFGETVGETSVDLVRRHDGESNIGNLIADAMREASGAEIAFMNIGGIRTDIPKGAITREQLFSLLPFDNVLITVELTGSRIVRVLEEAATLEKGMLQVSGMKIVYDMTRPPGKRVTEARAGDAPLEPERKYRVVINDFLAAGGDRFEAFKEGEKALYGDELREAVLSYLRKHSPVAPQVEGRIGTVR